MSHKSRHSKDEDDDSFASSKRYRTNSMESRRLVEYFLVFSCEPQRRKPPNPQTISHDDKTKHSVSGNAEDRTNSSSPVTSLERDECHEKDPSSVSKEKRERREGEEKGETKEKRPNQHGHHHDVLEQQIQQQQEEEDDGILLPTTLYESKKEQQGFTTVTVDNKKGSPLFHHRMSKRAVHLKVVPDGGIGTGITAAAAAAAAAGGDEGIIQRICEIDLHDGTTKVQEQKKKQQYNTLLTRNSCSVRIPATTESEANLISSDTEPSVTTGLLDVMERGAGDVRHDEKKSMNLHKPLMPSPPKTMTASATTTTEWTPSKPKHVVTNNNDDDNGQSWDFESMMTPSRIRALDSDNSEVESITSDHDDDNIILSSASSGVPVADETEEKNLDHGPQKSMEDLSSIAESSPSRVLDTTVRSHGDDVGDGGGNIHLPVALDSNPAEDTNDPLALHFTLKPVKTAQYPLKEHLDCPLNPMVSHFCFPQVLNLTTEYQMPRVHFFVLTNDKGKKLYGTALTVWEEYPVSENDSSDLNREILQMLMPKEDIGCSYSDGGDIEVSLTDEKKTLYVPKVLCILSAWPYLHSFREYLAQLYRLATMTDLMTAPIERYVQNICDAPAPPPGIFELQIKILSSNLKFWAPPGDQPIAYVALPFRVLFECLDVDNIIFVWYALTLERKVLLVSSQFSLLTICSEILCSLLFPMKWSHLYIPILPLFLSPMLDAPMPYLCGITRQNFAKSIGDINDETIVVDLDQNLITLGDKTPPFPPIPLKRRSKLEKNLQKNVGEMFWRTRGLTQADIQTQNADALHTKMLITADRIWREKLQCYDDAFNLAYTPDSETLLNGDSRQGSIDGYIDSNLKQSTWDAVQETFLRFYVSMLREYNKYIFIRQGHKSFKTEEFISSQRSDYRYFLREFCCTQQFDCFITKRLNEPMSPDILFFDQSITAKKNRSKMTFKKKETAFLISAKAHRSLQVIEMTQPTCENEATSNLLDQIYAAASPKKCYMYKVWPQVFDKELFGVPKPLPTSIAAEFSRMDSIARSVKYGHEDALVDDFRPGVSHSSLDVATFTLFFALYCKIVGVDFEILRKKLNPSLQKQHNLLPPHVFNSVENDKAPRVGHDCGTNICSPCSGSVSKNIIVSETVAILQQTTEQTLDSSNRNHYEKHSGASYENDIEAAQIVATRQLDLAFSVLETMQLRGLPTDQYAFKVIMEACGRCGSMNRATQLITMMKEQSVPIDSEVYSNYLLAFSVANEMNPEETIQSPITNVPFRSFEHDTVKFRNKNKWFSRDKTNRAQVLPSRGHSFETSETSSISARSDASFSDSKKVSRPGSAIKKVPQNKSIDILTNDFVERHVMMGECLLKEDLHGGIDIDIKGDNCPQCTLFLTTEQIMTGWTPCSFSEYKTKCTHCEYKFLPRFVVTSRSLDFLGTQGSGTPLYCEFFSPWVLRRELFLATDGGNNMKSILDPQQRQNCEFNNKLWWNMVVHLRMQKLPITFLLEGCFPGTLIL